MECNWYSFSSGFSGITYGAGFALGNRVRAELYIDCGDGDKNKELFDWLAQEKEKIEGEFGEPFEWGRLDDKRASRIAVYRQGSIDDNEQALEEIRAWTVERLLKLKKVFSGRLKKYGKL